jgi:hypothetical protein
MKKILYLAVPFALLACNPATNIKEPIEDRQMSKGRISIPLTSTSSSGAMYYLQIPTVVLEGDQRLEFSAENNDDFDISLQEGEYNLSIHDWTLYRIEGDENIQVNAEIISDNPQHITIHGGETTHTVIRLRTINDEVTFDQGHLNVEIEVEDGNPPIATPDQGTTAECGEETFQGDINFTDQESLSQFAAQHSTVQGHLSLQGEGIVDASVLSCLSSISLTITNTLIEDVLLAEQEYLHRLIVTDNQNLSSLLLSVEEIDHLEIYRNEQLTSITAEQSSSYGLSIQENPSLQNINLQVLEEIEGDFYIQNNTELRNITAPDLGYVGNRIRIVENTELEELSLPSLESTGGYILIQDNESIQNIAMPNLFVIGEPTASASTSADLLISNNASLISTDFSDLFFISRNLRISDNSSLISLDDFRQLTSIQHLTITGNARLNDVLGLSTLTDVQNINISFNPHLPETMIDYLHKVEIGVEAILGVTILSNNSPVELETYDLSSCDAEYRAMESGDLFPAGSVLHMSFTASQGCSSDQQLADASNWQIIGDCSCN